MKNVLKKMEVQTDKLIDRAQKAVDEKNMTDPDKRIRVWRKPA